MNKHAVRILRTLAGVAILAALLYFVGLEEVFSTLTSVDSTVAPIMAVYYVVFFFIAAFTYKMLTSPIATIGFFRLMKHYAVSWSIGMLLPGRVGDLSIAYFLSKEKMSIGQGAALAVLEKAITVAILLGLGALSLLVLYPTIQVLIAIFAAGIVGLILLGLMISKKGQSIIRGFLPGFIEKKIAGFQDALFMMIEKHPITLVLVGIATVFRWGASITAIFLIFQMYGADISYVTVLLFQALILLITLVPISINGLGVRETSAVLLFSQAGVPEAVTVSVYLLFALINYILAGILLFIHFVLEK